MTRHGRIAGWTHSSRTRWVGLYGFSSGELPSDRTRAYCWMDTLKPDEMSRPVWFLFRRTSSDRTRAYSWMDTLKPDEASRLVWFLFRRTSSNRTRAYSWMDTLKPEEVSRPVWFLFRRTSSGKTGAYAGWAHSSQRRWVGRYGSSSGELQDSTGQGLTIRWTYSGQWRVGITLILSGHTLKLGWSSPFPHDWTAPWGSELLETARLMFHTQ